MRTILFLLALTLLSSCGACGGSDDIDPTLQAQLDSMMTAHRDTVQTINLSQQNLPTDQTVTCKVYSDDGIQFYPKQVAFELQKGVFIIKSGNSSIPYNINSELQANGDVTKFSCYCSLDEWYSDASIERLLVTLVGSDGNITKVRLNGRTFYTEVPSLLREEDDVYIVKPGDKMSVLVRKLGITEDCIKTQIGVPEVGEKINTNACN